jgi:hypothetical protein
MKTVNKKCQVLFYPLERQPNKKTAFAPISQDALVDHSS